MPLLRTSLIAAALLASAAPAFATNPYNVYITEWMYKPNASSTNASGFGEYAEITNTGSAAVNLSGWKLDDSHEGSTGAAFDISSIGSLGAGKSAIITDDDAANFRSVWNLAAAVPIVGGHNADNFGSADEINIFDASNTLVDKLTYDSVGTPATVGFSANIPRSDLGNNATLASAAVLSSVGDAFNSVTSTEGNVGNPGFYPAAVPTPEPASLALLTLAATPLLLRRRRR